MPTVQVGSHMVYYEEYGHGHPLVLIAGLGASRFSWRKQVEPLSQQFRVITFDNRDAGDSAQSSEPYQILQMAADTAGLIRHLGIATTHVMGWSMGGFIALELAIHHPALIDRLVLVATSAGGATHVGPTPAVTMSLMRQEGETIEQRVRRTQPLMAGPGFFERQPEELDESVKYALLKPMSLEAYMRQLNACMMHDAARRLSEIKAPTLVIHGADDPLVPYANGQYLAAHIPGAKLSTYQGVGHLPPTEATERFNREVLEFLGS